MAEFDSIINFIEAHDIALQVMRKIVGNSSLFNQIE